jgi:hypothetical protein
VSATRRHADASPSPERFFFVHVQKTAGTSLAFRLRRHFGRDAVYPRPSDDRDAVLSVPHLVERWRADGDRMRVVTGHFPLCTTELLDGGFTTLTVLREPVERTLSYLRHHKVFERDDPRTVEEVYADPFRYHGLVHNHMVKMFSLTVEEMTAGMLTKVDFGPEHLARACANLESVDVVGLQEDFEGFCDELRQRFGWELGPPTVMNRTEPLEVADAFRSRILEDNALDVAFYEFAEQLVRDRAVRGPGAPSASGVGSGTDPTG